MAVVSVPVTVVEHHHPVTSVALLRAMVAEVVAAGARVVEAAVVVDVTETPTTAGEFWFGGREGYQVYSDEWVAARSWYFTKLVSPLCGCYIRGEFGRRCGVCIRGIRVYLRLHITGLAKGKCKPVIASASLGMTTDKYDRFTCTLGEAKVSTLTEAKRWAEGSFTPFGIKLVLQRYYATHDLKKRGQLIEILDPELGWIEWLWTFEEHPDWGHLLGHNKARCTNASGQTMFILPTGHGWSIQPWLSAWDRVSREDAFGVV